MRVGITGTPGTGKSTAIELLATGTGLGDAFDIIHLNDVIRRDELHDGTDDRGSLIADISALRDRLSDRDDILVESHLAHYLDNLDRIVVLRCHPDELSRRLRQRGEHQQTVADNAQVEALDLILTETLDRHARDSVYEIPTTEKTPGQVANEINGVVANDADATVGTVDYSAYLRGQSTPREQHPAVTRTNDTGDTREEDER